MIDFFLSWNAIKINFKRNMSNILSVDRGINRKKNYGKLIKAVG